MRQYIYFLTDTRKCVAEFPNLHVVMDAGQKYAINCLFTGKPLSPVCWFGSCFGLQIII